MCAIIDANVAHEVFGPDWSPAGEKFFAWLRTGKGKVIVGGKLLEELGNSHQLQISGLIRAGIALRIDSNQVQAKTQQIARKGISRSNDAHVLALAQISGARLLYTNDRNLQQDFRDKRLIDKPRGTVYTTIRSKEFTDTHKDILNKPNLCQARS